jgi:hypothetical protein
MSLADVRRVLADPTAHLEGNTPEVPLDACAYLESKALPEHLGFMFGKGRVVRIDVSSVGIRTASGAGVGDTEAKIKVLYPGLITVEPHHYDPENGHYLNYSPHDKTDRGYGIVFETDGTVVTEFRVGTLAAIALVEGCS